MATSVELSDEKNLSTVINYLRDSNATEDLLLDEVVTHKDVLASDASKKLVSDVPVLLEYIGEVLTDMLEVSKSIVKNSFQLIQNDRENAEEARLRANDNKSSDRATSSVTFGDVKSKLNEGIFGNLLLTGIFGLGTIVGFVEEIVKMIKKTRIAKWVKSMTTSFKETSVGKFIDDVSKFVSTQANKIKEYTVGIVDKVKSFSKNTFAKLFSKDKGIFSFVGKGLEFIQKAFSFFRGGGKLSFIDDIGKLLSKFSFFYKIGKGFGRILGKLALPLTIIITAFETISAAIEGYKAEGILGAVRGGIGGLLSSLVGSVADLLKDGLSWAFKKLGFESVSKALDSFSFSELLTTGVDAIFDTLEYFVEYLKTEFSFTKLKESFDKFGLAGFQIMVVGGIMNMMKGAVSWLLTVFGQTDEAAALDGFSFQEFFNSILQARNDLINKIKDSVFLAVSKIGKWFNSIPQEMENLLKSTVDVSSNLIKTILQNVLPKPDTTKSWYDPINLAAAAIPASVYEYAGMDPKTGKVISTVGIEKPAAVTPIPKQTAAAISNGGVAAPVTIINNNINKGGDVHNVSNSNVNNNVNGAAGPILTGSAMGLYAV